jgi:hypothetical protein
MIRALLVTLGVSFVSVFVSAFAETATEESASMTKTIFNSARVLVTGFEPFGGYDYNPSGDVALALAGTCMNYTYMNKDNTIENVHTCFDGWVLPVDSAGSSRVANVLTSGEPFPYDAILHLGLEDVAKGLKLETFALNQLAEPDGSEPQGSVCLTNSNYDQPTAPPAVPGAQCELPTTANLGRLSLEEALVFAAPRGSIADASRLERLEVCLREAWSRDAGSNVVMSWLLGGEGRACGVM